MELYAARNDGAASVELGAPKDAHAAACLCANTLTRAEILPEAFERASPSRLAALACSNRSILLQDALQRRIGLVDEAAVLRAAVQDARAEAAAKFGGAALETVSALMQRRWTDS